MKKQILITISLILVLATVTGVVVLISVAAPGVADEYVVHITDEGFAPQVITVPVGSTVTWINDRVEPVSIHSGLPYVYLAPSIFKNFDPFGESPRHEEGLAPPGWGAAIQPGESWSWTSTAADLGENPYRFGTCCTATDPEHPGNIFVIEASPPTNTPTATSAPSPTATNTPTATPTPTSTPTPTPTATPTPTSTPTPTTIPIPTSTPTPTLCVLEPVVAPTPPAYTPGYAQLDPTTGLHMTGTPQQIDLESYRLEVNGKVDYPLSLTYDDLRCLPKVETWAILECPGFFIDEATWAGTPILEVLALAGVQEGATRLTLVSADGYWTTVPINEELLENAFLAYEWEGEPLPILHGFPVRLAFPEVSGNFWVKWLVAIEVQ
jgi:hypothetical protein